MLQQYRFLYRADIKRVPADAADDAERETVVSQLKCSEVVEVSQDEAERHGMGTVASLHRAETAVPVPTGVGNGGAAVIRERDRFVIGGVDYRIRKVNPVPKNAPQYLQLFLEDES